MCSRTGIEDINTALFHFVKIVGCDDVLFPVEDRFLWSTVTKELLHDSCSIRWTNTHNGAIEIIQLTNTLLGGSSIDFIADLSSASFLDLNGFSFIHVWDASFCIIFIVYCPVELLLRKVVLAFSNRILSIGLSSPDVFIAPPSTYCLFYECGLSSMTTFNGKNLVGVTKCEESESRGPLKVHKILSGRNSVPHYPNPRPFSCRYSQPL